MNARGQYGRSTAGMRYVTPGVYGTPTVGALYHSVSDRADAVRQLAVDWTALYQNLASQAGELTHDAKSPSGYRLMTQVEWNANPPDPKKAVWWKSYAKPIFNAWSKFKSEQLGVSTIASDYIAFAERWQTNWDVYEGWKNKLDALRAEAQKQGFAISAPRPTALPTTIWTDVAEGAEAVGRGASDAWTFVKYAAWGILGLGTIVALSSVAQSMRTGKDPADKYVQMIRRGGRSAARTFLPPPVRLALPQEPTP